MSHNNPGWYEKLRYRFDNTLSRGTVSIILWLGVISFIIVLIAALVVYLFGINPPDDQLSFPEALWQSLMHSMDAGTVAGDSGWAYRALMFVVTIGGIFILSSLIGTITSGLEAKLDELRKGHSRVIEQEHTLILGWSPKIFTIISELIIANQNRKNARIVILADKDKVEMEDEIRSKFSSTANTKIICRSGSSLDLDDLEVVSPHHARSIIILSPEDTDHPDTFVIKSILALTNNPNRKKEPYHIAAELRDMRNMEAAELVGGSEASVIMSSDLIARVAAQTCRQSGLSVVYTELMDFDGAEIYFTEEKSLIGKTYRFILDAFEESTVIGIMKKDGTVHINPSMELKYEAGDSVIAISEDDDTLVVSEKKSSADESLISLKDAPPAGKEKTLILGWNEKGSSIITELDSYVAEGSEVYIVNEDESASEEIDLLKEKLVRQHITYSKASITEKAVIESLDAPQFNHIILLCSSSLPVQEADAQVLISLLHLRNISEKSGKAFSIVSEMRDIRNRTLAEVAKADDFIVSDNLVSLLLSQISENKHLVKVFHELFRAEGSEIYLKPVSEYIQTGVPVDFYTLTEAASRKGETAIGYRIQSQAHDITKAYGVKVNPKKSVKITFTPDDKLIVLAEN
ncbi:MAG: lipoprotein [Bacteroidia bacterium]